MKKIILSEVRQLQKIAGILKENEIPGSPDPISMKVLLDVLGLDSNDAIFNHAIQSGDIEELLQMIEDTAGLDQFTKSDLVQAMQEAQFDDDLIAQIIDEHPIIKNLERG